MNDLRPHALGPATLRFTRFAPLRAALFLLAVCAASAVLGGLYAALDRQAVTAEVMVTVTERPKGPAPEPEPLAGVKVVLHALDDEGHVFSSGMTGGDGSVTLTAPRDQLDYDGHAFTKVVARMVQDDYVPTSTRVRLSWARGPEAFLAKLRTRRVRVQRPDAPVVGAAQMEGRLADARGAPVPRVRLMATWIPPNAADGQDALDEPFLSQISMRGQRQFRQSAVTDDAGHYSFKGLIEGTFRIDADRQTEVTGRYRLETLGHQVASVEPGHAPDPAEFEFTRPTIVVTVDQGPSENPCDIVLYDAGATGSLPWARLGWKWSGLPVAGPFARLYGPDSWAPDYDGLTGTFEVPKGRQYFLCAHGEGYDPRPKLVTVPGDGSPAYAAVGPPTDPATGTLRVHLALGELEIPKDADEWFGDMVQYGVFVQDVESAIPLGIYEKEALAKGPPELLLPAGPVRVVASGIPGGEYPDGISMPARVYGRTEQIVQVRPGAVTTVELELTCNGGHLEVTLTGELTADDWARMASETALMQERYGGGYFDANECEEPGESERTPYGTLYLEDPARRLWAPVRRAASAAADALADEEPLLGNWAMGETHRSSLLPPGNYTLHATFPGRPSIELGVTVTDGDTTKVELDFGE